jgi:hypothetical protein
MKIVYSDQKIPTNLVTEPSIFLAGPTPRSLDVPSWRPHALELLKKIGYCGIVLVPEHQVRSDKADYTDQVEWEWEGLENAKAIAFWVPREIQTMPGFTTNVEFGSYIRSNRSVYGRPPEAQKCRYLDWLYEKTRGVKPHTNLEDLMFHTSLVALKRS